MFKRATFLSFATSDVQTEAPPCHVHRADSSSFPLERQLYPAFVGNQSRKNIRLHVDMATPSRKTYFQRQQQQQHWSGETVVLYSTGGSSYKGGGGCHQAIGNNIEYLKETGFFLIIAMSIAI